MAQIEFFTYGPDRLWGARIDGADLRVRAADAVRPLWEEEQRPEEPAEIEEFLFRQYAGLAEADLGDPVAHFLGGAAGPAGRTAVLGCDCGLWQCWPLLTRITADAGSVVWSSFRQPHRPAWGDLALGPFAFPRPAYERALGAPVHLPEDPFTGLT
ncbi:hypothetical protein ACIQBJ_02000 [Kitasatospora sp. NPDC088391]|uniref:hypothetical protein n=1 Tax=Kitasatospora sp. NPDC088391 TaxID=3364074 RepID=UPI0037F9D5A1